MELIEEMPGVDGRPVWARYRLHDGTVVIVCTEGAVEEPVTRCYPDPTPAAPTATVMPEPLGTAEGDDHQAAIEAAGLT